MSNLNVAGFARIQFSRNSIQSLATSATLLVTLLLSFGSVAQAQRLDEMALDRWAKLRETERYQLNIAERYYREKNYKVATAEYEKYLTLYEDSVGAPYSQLKWSICQVRLRNANTAIKEGFQSVLDYWPESPEAIASVFYIAQTYKNIGQVSKAKVAYRKVLADHEDHLVTVLSLVDLSAIALAEKDTDALVQFRKKLTFDFARNKYNSSYCVTASQQLASHYFHNAAFDEGRKALATTYTEEQLPTYVVNYASGAIRTLVANSETKGKGESLTKNCVAFLTESMPGDISDDAGKTRAKQLWYYIADIHSTAQHLDEVPKIYKTIEGKFGVEDETLARLAAWYKTQTDYDKARATYNRYKDRLEAGNQVALSYRQQKEIDRAVGVYNQLIARDPDGEIRWKSEIAAAYREAKKYAEAILTYTDLLSLDSENSEKWRWQIASAHQAANQFKEAIAHYRQCTNFPENNKQMAACHRAMKQYNEALLMYNQIVGGHEPSAPWALYQIAYTRELAGQKEQAIKAFQIVCKRFPKNTYASQAHARLQSQYGISVTLGGGKDK